MAAVLVSKSDLVWAAGFANAFEGSWRKPWTCASRRKSETASLSKRSGERSWRVIATSFQDLRECQKRSNMKEGTAWGQTDSKTLSPFRHWPSGGK